MLNLLSLLREFHFFNSIQFFPIFKNYSKILTLLQNPENLPLMV